MSNTGSPTVEMPKQAVEALESASERVSERVADLEHENELLRELAKQSRQLGDANRIGGES
jgi:hypothetical protein